MLSSPVLASTLSATAYMQIKRAIVRCDLPPGSQISQSALAERYSLGRAAVRTALNRLSQEGLAQNFPRRGHIIAPITLRDVREVFDLRQQVEPVAVVRAAKADNVDARYLRDLERACSAARYEPGNRSDIERFLRANTSLHVGIANLANNHRVTDLLQGLLEASERFFHLALRVTDRNDEMHHEHYDLVEAILAHDTERARTTTIEQLDTAEGMVIDAILHSPALSAANAYSEYSDFTASRGQNE